METKDKYKFILLNLIVLYVTMPGSVYIAYFDSYKSMSVVIGFYNWLYSYLVFSPIILAYLAIKREKIVVAYAVFIAFLAVLYVVLFPYVFPKAKLSTSIMFEAIQEVVFLLILSVMFNPLTYLQFHPLFSIVNFVLLALILLFLYKILKV